MDDFPKTLAESLVRALGALSNVVRDEAATIQGKDGKPGYSYRYADLGGLLTGVRPVLASQGLAITQGVTNDGRQVSVTTTILHWSGESMTTEALSLPGAGTPQAVGSAITYARRYQLMAVLGLASDDDDGQQAAATPYVERHVEPPAANPEREAAIEVFEAIRALSVDDKKVYSEWVKSFEHPAATVPAMTADAAWRETVAKKVTEIAVGFSADDPNDPLEPVQGELVSS